MDASCASTGALTAPGDLLDELRPDDPAADALAADAASLETDAETAKHRDRSAIGRWVVVVFLTVVVVLLLYILVGTLVFGWEKIQTPAEYASTTVGSILLPVVTLVFCYYFGASQAPP